MEKIIELKQVSKVFKGDTVLRNVNLELYDQHIYGFIGRNGSGKSVLFKLICGYMHASSGEVIVNGKLIGKDVDFPESLGVLIESPGFLWHETGLENLNYLARINNKISTEDVKTAIREVGLDPNSKKRVGKYSLGMKQRLGIAQAIMEEPKILILDEPMNALDDSGVEDIRELILGFKGKGKIVLIASHNKEDISILCDKVYRVSEGNVELLE